MYIVHKLFRFYTADRALFLRQMFTLKKEIKLLLWRAGFVVMMAKESALCARFVNVEVVFSLPKSAFH